MNYMRDNADQMSAEDLAAVQQLIASSATYDLAAISSRVQSHGDDGDDDDGDGEAEEMEEEEGESSDAWDYDRLVALGQTIGGHHHYHHKQYLIVTANRCED
jgi:hypothetical protein